MPEIIVVDPDPSWPNRFAVERARVLAAVGSGFVHLEHIGSTAVPALAAKPVIDLLGAIERIDHVEVIARQLEPLGYEHRPRAMTDTDAAYFRRMEGGVRTHHLHVILVEHWAGDARRRFRDILRDRPDLAAAYAALKRDLAQIHAEDRMAYTDAKTDFVTSVLAAPPANRTR